MTENCVAGSVQFYTVSEAATLLEWSEDRVWMALETGQLPAIAPAFWGNPEEPIKYRFATPAVVLAIRAANTDEVAWMDDGPVGPARFPADPSKIRLLAEYVDALLGLSSGTEPAASGVRCAEVRGDSGVSKREILAVFSKPIQGQTEEQWANMLGDVPDWLKSARVDRGGRGVQSRWNPAELAQCLAKKGHMGRGTLGSLIHRHFPEYVPEWEAVPEREAYAGSFERR